MTGHRNVKRMIAIDVRSRNFSFVVFESPNRMLDWGIKSFRRGVNAVKVPADEKLLALLDEFRPSVIVAKKTSSLASQNGVKTFAVVERRARSRKIPVRVVSPQDIRRALVHGTKYEIARALVRQFPTLASKLPPKRKCWQSEHYRMGIFDAAAAGVAYCIRRRRPFVVPGRSADPGSVTRKESEGPP